MKMFHEPELQMLLDLWGFLTLYFDNINVKRQ